MWNVFLIIQLATAVGGPASQPQTPSAVTSGCPDRTLYSMVCVFGPPARSLPRKGARGAWIRERRPDASAIAERGSGWPYL